MKRIENKSFISKTLYCLCIAGCIALAAGCSDSSSGVVNVDITNCNVGDTRCTDDLKSTLTCNDKGEWDNLQACPADKPVCNDNTGLCEADNDACRTGDTKCDDSTHLSTCGDDHKWKSEVCPADKPSCNADLQRCVLTGYECDEGSKQCDDETHLSVCGNDNRWHTDPCPEDRPKCYGGISDCVEASFECSAGESTCADDFKGLKTCGEDNKWAAPEPCPADKPVCDPYEVACAEVATDCVPDTFECIDSNQYHICGFDGRWQNDEYCPLDKPVCNGEEHQCISEPCEPSARECFDEAHYRDCAGDARWGELIPCPAELPYCDASTNDCANLNPTACTPDTDFCFGGNAESAAMYHCTAEGTKPAEPLYFCPDGCNDEGTACKQTKCTPEAVQCTSDHSGVMICKEDGSWDLENIQKCPLGLSCNGDTNQCECTPGEPVCTHIGSKSEGLYHCTAKGEVGERIEWCKCTSDYKACSCENDGVNELGGERRKCRGTDSMVCEGGAWKVAKNCSRSEVCNDKVGGICIPAKTNGGVCIDDESICDANTVLTCQDGLYENLESGCGAKEFCAMSMNESGSVAKCVSSCASTTFCSPMGIVSCDSAGNTSVKPCAKSQKCVMKPVSSSPIPEQVTYKATCEMDVCAEGELSCGDESVLQVCRNNEWIKLVNCEADYHMPCISHEDIIGCYMSVLSAPLP